MRKIKLTVSRVCVPFVLATISRGDRQLIVASFTPESPSLLWSVCSAQDLEIALEHVLGCGGTQLCRRTHAVPTKVLTYVIFSFEKIL
eukprot:1332507-Amphidinium_carterae.1